jgi:hypothetical protein
MIPVRASLLASKGEDQSCAVPKVMLIRTVIYPRKEVIQLDWSERNHVIQSDVQRTSGCHCEPCGTRGKMYEIGSCAAAKYSSPASQQL